MKVPRHRFDAWHWRVWSLFFKIFALVFVTLNNVNQWISNLKVIFLQVLELIFLERDRCWPWCWPWIRIRKWDPHPHGRRKRPVRRTKKKPRCQQLRHAQRGSGYWVILHVLTISTTSWTINSNICADHPETRYQIDCILLGSWVWCTLSHHQFIPRNHRFEIQFFSHFRRPLSFWRYSWVGCHSRDIEEIGSWRRGSSEGGFPMKGQYRNISNRSH